MFINLWVLLFIFFLGCLVIYLISPLPYMFCLLFWGGFDSDLIWNGDVWMDKCFCCRHGDDARLFWLGDEACLLEVAVVVSA